MIISKKKINSSLLEGIAQYGINPQKCMQCGKCSASCPINRISTILPHQVMRILQLGMENELIKQNNLLYQCLTCFTCQERCPQGIEIPKIMKVIWEKLFKIEETTLDRDEIISFRNKGLPEQAIITGLKKYQKTDDLRVKKMLKKL